MKYVKGLRPTPAMIVSIIALFIAGAGGAYAAAQISGNDLVNNSVASKKVKNHTLKKKDLNRKFAKKLGQPGQPGQPGQDGTDGVDGTDGTATYAGPNWSIIDRNTEGSPSVALRAGPTFGTGAGQKPPLGVGSLGIVTGSNTEKATFGNMVDFLGDPVSGLDQVEYSYFQTGEDWDRSAANVPNVSFEIDPGLTKADGPDLDSDPDPVNYSSMVYVAPAPATRQDQQWVNEDADANPGGSNGWYFTNGTTATATGCDQTPYCSLADAKAGLATAHAATEPAAAILSVAFGQGKGQQPYEGAADALQINNTIYDFEPFGVSEVAVP